MEGLGQRLTNLREHNGWTKTYVVKKLGLSNLGTYANYEYGTREPDLETLKKISKLYGVTVDYLIGNNEKSFKSPDWATEGDRIDLDKMLQSNIQMGFGGMDWNKDDKVKIRRVLESIFWDQLKELREKGKK